MDGISSNPDLSYRVYDIYLYHLEYIVSSVSFIYHSVHSTMSRPSSSSYPESSSSSPSASSSGSAWVPGCKLYVGNLDHAVVEAELSEIFQNAGRLSKVWVAR